MNNRLCKHCKKEFNIFEKPKGWMANHSRWCDYNPKRQDYVNKLIGNNSKIDLMNQSKKKTGFTNQFTKSKLESKPIPLGTQTGKIGTFTGKTHTKETKQLMRDKALSSNHRRLKKGVVYYNGVMLDSSWELALAKRLDDIKVEWIRPDPIKYLDDEGLTHNYFADFYLPKYDKYLDPKNPYAIKVQSKKINNLMDQYNNIEILDSLEKCINFNI